jgi:hypothetical protein
VSQQKAQLVIVSSEKRKPVKKDYETTFWRDTSLALAELFARYGEDHRTGSDWVKYAILLCYRDNTNLKLVQIR